MLSLRRFAFASAFTLLLACDAADDTGPSCEQPVLPAPDEGFILGLAGVPQGTFGAANAPDFEAGFNTLADHGFNQFVPVFLTDESGAGTEELTYFLPPSATGASEDRSCLGSRTRGRPARVCRSFYRAICSCPRWRRRSRWSRRW
jgi:hypothetical protein